MSTNFPSIFTTTNLSSGKEAYKKALGTSNIATSLYSTASIRVVTTRASRDSVEDDDSSLDTYPRCFLPSATDLPFIFPVRFSLIVLITFQAFSSLKALLLRKPLDHSIVYTLCR